MIAITDPLHCGRYGTVLLRADRSVLGLAGLQITAAAIMITAIIVQPVTVAQRLMGGPQSGAAMTHHVDASRCLTGACYR
jgi:hypothetical protein